MHEREHFVKLERALTNQRRVCPCAQGLTGNDLAAPRLLVFLRHTFCSITHCYQVCLPLSAFMTCRRRPLCLRMAGHDKLNARDWLAGSPRLCGCRSYRQRLSGHAAITRTSRTDIDACWVSQDRGTDILRQRRTAVYIRTLHHVSL